MNKFTSLLAGALLILSTAALAAAQTGTTTTTTVTTPTTVTKTTQNADGTYTVVEYPVGKETIVNLTPVTITGAKGVATVLRDDNGTRIKLNLTGVPNDVTGLNLYAVDPAGVVTSLGPIVVTNGLGTFETTTPLNRFMLVASPEATLTTYDPNTKVFFRSAAPEGFAVIPHSVVPLGENVGATGVATTEASAYTVPMLNIPAFKRGDDTKIKVNFTGAMSGTRANVFIEPHRGKATEVKMVFHELKDAPAGQSFIVWAVSPDNQFQKLGQILNLKNKNEAEVKATTTFPDFGLLVTQEDIGVVKSTVLVPAGPRLGVIEIIR
jgi:hypothetical protein